MSSASGSGSGGVHSTARGYVSGKGPSYGLQFPIPDELDVGLHDHLARDGFSESQTAVLTRGNARLCDECQEPNFYDDLNQAACDAWICRGCIQQHLRTCWECRAAGEVETAFACQMCGSSSGHYGWVSHQRFCIQCHSLQDHQKSTLDAGHRTCDAGQRSIGDGDIEMNKDQELDDASFLHRMVEVVGNPDCPPPRKPAAMPSLHDAA